MAYASDAFCVQCPREAGTQIAHKDPDAVRMVYNRAQYMDERRNMMKEWADYLGRLACAIPGSRGALGC